MVASDAVRTACEAAWRDMHRLESDLRSKGLMKGGLEVKLRVEAADLQTVLPQIARGLDLGLIVVGTHGRTGWKKVVLGSVAEILVDHAPCPVLTVGPSSNRNRLEQFGPESILFARDPSARSKLAESYALCSRGNTTLDLPSLMCSKTAPDAFSRKRPRANGRNLR